MKFKDVTNAAGVAGHGYSMGTAAADFDNDGNVDLFVAGVFTNILYRNRGDGTFEDVTSRAGIKSLHWSVGAGWFDYDNDGKLDLFIVNYAKWSPDMDKFCGNEEKTSVFTATPSFSKACRTRFIEIGETVLSRTPAPRLVSADMSAEE